MVTLSAAIAFHAARTPEKLALVYGDRRITYCELLDRAGRMAGYLVARGIGPGDVVAACMKNSPAFIEIAIGASHIGAVFLPVNYRLAADEAAYVLANAGALLLLADAEFVPTLAPLVGHAVLAIQSVDGAAQADGRALAGRGRAIPAAAPGEPSDLMRLMYTSGTTDRPKGVMLSYENFHWKNMDLISALGLGPADRVLVVGPLYHVGGLDLPGLAVFAMGGHICLLRDFDPAAVLDAIECHGLTGAWFAPVMTNALLAFGNPVGRDLGSLEWVIGGGERTPESRIRAFGDLFPKARYIDAYGLTETVSGDTFMVAGMEIAKIGSVGLPLAHVQVEIRDDAGRQLPAGREGEICLRGPKVTKGYWRDPEKTRASFFGDWFRTGDVGYLDADGFLYLTDRKKDMIISGGENIASSEVERVLYELPQVLEAAVIGVPDERWGERPVAIAVLRAGEWLDLAALQVHCRAHLAGFKVPKELHLVETLPRNPSGKVLKRPLRERFAAEAATGATGEAL